MNRFLLTLVCLFILGWAAGCKSSSASISPSGGIVINLNGSFAVVEAGSGPITLTATTAGDSGNQGVSWALTVAGNACSPACGTLKPAPPPSLTAVYTPPAAPPLNQVATITVRSMADNSQVFLFNFQIFPPIVVQITTKFNSQTVLGAVTDLAATVTNDPSKSGVTWTLTVGGTDCQPVCGTLTVDPAPSFTAHYQPPAKPPAAAKASPTITALAVADANKMDSFGFNIATPTISVAIVTATKFTSQSTGGPAVKVAATITNDFTNAGLTWSLSPANCSPGCGTLTPAPAPSLSATYTPPPIPPAGANVSPTITATSKADSSQHDGFGFTIFTPAISVTITHKFSSELVGGPPVNVKAVITNDFTNVGLSWALTPVGCSPTCGTLTPAVAPSLSAVYTPPAAPPMGASASPTITATSVNDPSKSDTDSFTITAPIAIFQGHYAFLLRGYDKASTPMALAGSLVTDGMGNITGGELDYNDGGTITHAAGPLAGNYLVDTSFSGVPRITITITNFTIPGTAINLVLKSTFSADGKRGKVIEFDGSLALNAGSILFQDTTAASNLSAAASPSPFVFGLDSDAPVNGRVAEAGQFILGAGAASVTGGVADEYQAGGANPIFGGGLVPPGPAVISIAGSSATPPDASGRGTLTLSIPISGSPNSVAQYAYYVVNSSLLNLIEIDSGGSLKTVQAGTAQAQQALSANSVHSTSVMALTGLNTANVPPAPSVIVGVINSNLVTPPSCMLASPCIRYDVNDAGTVAVTQSPTTPQILTPLDTTTGRFVVSDTFEFSLWYVAIYISDAGTGYVLDITPTVAGTQLLNRAFSGPLIPQASGPFSVPADLSGNFIALAGGSAKSAIPNLDFAANFDDSVSANPLFSALLDITTPDLSIGANGQASNVSELAEPYYLSDTTFGIGRFNLPAGAFGDFASAQPILGSLYLIGPDQFVGIGLGNANGTGGSGLVPSGILVFDPQ